VNLALMPQRIFRRRWFNPWRLAQGDPTDRTISRDLRPPTGRSAACARILLPALMALLLFGGCAVGPNYKRVSTSIPDNFRFAASQSTNSFDDLPWWAVFRDPALLELIAIAVTNNYDLQKAVARVEQVRNLAVAARGPLLPQVGYGGNVGRGRNALFNSPAALNSATESSAAASLSAVWEIDLWGRLRRLSEAARAEYFATDEARRAVTSALVSDVATTYFQLLQFDRELTIQRAATNAYRSSLQLFEDRLQNGVASKLESDRATAALANAASIIPRLELSVATTENQLSILLGRNPGPIARNSLTNDMLIVPEIPAGLPSELLRRRPDVLEREQLLIAANANIGASLADFFPRIGMTTFIGKVSPELSAFSAGSANVWNVGASVTGPLFQGGQLRARYRAAKAKFDEAKSAYQQSILTALQEVSDALIAREKLGEARAFSEQASAALVASVDLATQRYVGGRSSYYEVLQAQQELYPTQRAQVQAQVGELISMVQLYKALGGGWQPAIR